MHDFDQGFFFDEILFLYWPLYYVLHILCVRSKLTISSILSLNWLKEEVAYWLKCVCTPQSFIYAVYASNRVCAQNARIVHNTEHTFVREITGPSILSRNGVIQFCFLVHSRSRVSFISRLAIHKHKHTQLTY